MSNQNIGNAACVHKFDALVSSTADIEKNKVEVDKEKGVGRFKSMESSQTVENKLSLDDEIQNSATFSKYYPYQIEVDPAQDDKATEIKLCSFARPHMRAFHFAWWSYHVAFLMWFSISPLLIEVQKTLEITKEQIWTSSITAVSGTILMRFLLGPFCDKYGPRIPMGVILFVSAVPTAMTGLVNTAQDLAIMRFFIGMGGSTFVMCQYWTTTMFSKEWCGTANATVGGWGNLGGGITQLLVGSFLFPLLKNFFDDDAEKAWRTACIVPALLGLITAFCVVKYSDDSPKGNYAKLKKRDEMEDVNALNFFKSGARNFNTWLLFVQYACCFGVEITMNNTAAIYFSEKFYLSTERAAAVASIFGWMNIFARGLGGYISDKMNDRYGMRGRLFWQTFVLLLEGLLVIIFAFSGSLASSIAVLILFSIFVQAAEGSTYGIVPYINLTATGSTSGIIGAGGNTGAVVFSLIFRQLGETRNAFILIGTIIISSSLLSVFVNIKDHPGWFYHQENQVLEKEERQSFDEDSVTEFASDESPRSIKTFSFSEKG